MSSGGEPQPESGEGVRVADGAAVQDSSPRLMDEVISVLDRNNSGAVTPDEVNSERGAITAPITGLTRNGQDVTAAFGSIGEFIGEKINEIAGDKPLGQGINAADLRKYLQTPSGSKAFEEWLAKGEAGQNFAKTEFGQKFIETFNRLKPKEKPLEVKDYLLDFSIRKGPDLRKILEGAGSPDGKEANLMISSMDAFENWMKESERGKQFANTDLGGALGKVFKGQNLSEDERKRALDSVPPEMRDSPLGSMISEMLNSSGNPDSSMGKMLQQRAELLKQFPPETLKAVGAQIKGPGSDLGKIVQSLLDFGDTLDKLDQDFGQGEIIDKLMSGQQITQADIKGLIENFPDDLKEALQTQLSNLPPERMAAILKTILSLRRG